ncbi:helix-turn-helix domain-containing protein [Herbihabitans rhizosphaerae]|uniref:helix-turn-helix domain-containing protein n=1 Tax=Herbihabitans rhizosphaerae TaxID=1872711 RepID=UPI0013EEB3DE|nr:helix-turn-helix transcriptional regulator [Herbihabitans rhizosphaerae]
MEVTTQTPRTRALAHELRKAFEQAGIRIRDLAKKCGVSHTTISFWINGKRVPSPEQVATLLAHLGVSAEECDRIMDIARRAGDTNWLPAGALGISQQLAGVLECESTAATITEWSPHLIPGLLQTGDYARVIIGGQSGVADTQVRIRLGRRDILTRRNPTRFDALVGEAAITDVIGDKEVMADQLRAMLALTDHDNIRLRVVRQGIGWHRGLHGPFVFYEFSKTPPIVHVEHLRAGAFLYDPDVIQIYSEACVNLDQVALNPDQSVDLIKKRIEELEKQE